jgi:CRP-like cAMP-binding protein
MMHPWQSRLISIFNSKLRLQESAQADLLKYWTHERELKRNDFLIRKDTTETNLFYVIDGAMRIFFPHDAEEICVGFAYEHSLICSYPSFIQEKPSLYDIQALSKTTVVSISKKNFYSLFEKHRELETVWRMLQEEALIGKIERETEMLTFTPEERFHRLLKRSPQVFQIIPKKYIASYLRMTPETLSRLRPS